MNIMLFIDSLGGGGSQRQLANLGIGLQKRGHSVSIVTYVSINDHLSRVEAAGIKYLCLNKGSRFDIKPALKLARAIRQQAPAIVVAFLRTPSIYAELARIVSPTVPLLVSERAGLINGQLRLSDKIASILHLSATGVIANSQAYADGMSAFVPLLKKNTSVIYNGVDDLFFHSEQARATRAASEKSDLTQFCVAAARPGIEKGANTLAQALCLLKQSGRTDFQIDWIGPAPDDDEQVQSTNAILQSHSLEAHWTWLGHKNNISEYYNRYDALICPSLHEGVPNAICEAMATALPVIATNVGDNQQIIVTPEHGLRCAPDNPEALAKCLEHFLSLNQDERLKMGVSAHHRAQELFGMQNYIDHWEAALQRYV